MDRDHRRSARAAFTALACAVALVTLAGGAEAKKKRFKTPTRSSTIRLTKNDKIAVAVNRETNSLAVLQVRKGNQDTFALLAEVAVGADPRFVAVDPAGKVAFVTNGASGTVSVVALVGESRFTVIGTIPVGNEPRGCTLTPNGTRLFVANYADGTVSVIDTASLGVVGTVAVGGHPMAIAITTDRDRSDGDETVFVTEFFSELIAGKAEPFDDARQGVVHASRRAPWPGHEDHTRPAREQRLHRGSAKFCNLTTEPDPTARRTVPTRPSPIQPTTGSTTTRRAPSRTCSAPRSSAARASSCRTSARRPSRRSSST
jgi:YVTN family beta-propeller protein